jgi:hypothetical protein
MNRRFLLVLIPTRSRKAPQFRTPHSALRIQRRGPSIPHSAFRTPHSALKGGGGGGFNVRIGSDWFGLRGFCSDFVRGSCGQGFEFFIGIRRAASFERSVRSSALGSPSPIGWERAWVRVGTAHEAAAAGSHSCPLTLTLSAPRVAAEGLDDLFAGLAVWFMYSCHPVWCNKP